MQFSKKERKSFEKLLTVLLNQEFVLSPMIACCHLSWEIERATKITAKTLRFGGKHGGFCSQVYPKIQPCEG